MIIVFRNFFRNRMVNLTTKTVRKFIPNTTIHCISLYKQSEDDYIGQDLLDPTINNIFCKTSFVSTNTVTDHIDSSKTSGFQNGENGKYFAEGYNLAFQYFSSVDEKILLLSEDHFFTSGATLNELITHEFDLAYAPWDRELDANGSILCVRFNRLKHIFPLPYTAEPVERFLENNLTRKVSSDKLHAISTRKHADYKGDGKYTNSSEEMKQCMKEANLYD